MMLEKEHRARNDLVLAACANEQQLKCLIVVDEYTRVFLAIDVASSIRSHRVIEAMGRLISVRGAPQ
jgi:putative transposase